jgi:hypothetical protein
VINLNGKDYTATADKDGVKIDGKTVADFVKDKDTTKPVTVKTTVKADKIASVVAFTPASVSSVKVGTVTFTDITANSFKIGTASYTYTVSDKTIVVNGDAKTALQGLGDVATVTVK